MVYFQLVSPQIDWNHFLLHNTFPLSLFILQPDGSPESFQIQGTCVIIILMHHTGMCIGVVEEFNVQERCNVCMVIHDSSPPKLGVANAALRLFPDSRSDAAFFFFLTTRHFGARDRIRACVWCVSGRHNDIPTLGVTTPPRASGGALHSCAASCESEHRLQVKTRSQEPPLL